MKKYISPEIVVVQLRMKNVVLQMSSMDVDSTQTLEQNEILTKGVINDRSIWDEEW